ncbi:hypothetical protein [Arthrobacter rhizosphaerae]|uniref:hypothetical protein n=1 Tax=Arthrobacter rhizosphaerae TaxID=2855490 RepID=UPI001FF46A26|nr:hypothetical protein [Arthrobacter rhizosphaerae]
MQTVAVETTDATDVTGREETLRAELTGIVGGVIENHPGPDVEAMVDDVVTALVEKLRLHASKLFVAKHDDRPAEKFRTVTGRMDVTDS